MVAGASLLLAMETNFEVQCPFCGESIFLDFYEEEGRHQELVVDCEVCCNPIQYDVRFGNEGEINISAQRAQ